MQVDVVWFPREGPGGDKFSEKVFRGPLARMTRDALDYIRRGFINETVIKHPGRAEATRVENVPYEAIEEAVVNAVYHRGYDVREPVEIRVMHDELTVLSYPGPDRSVRLEQLRSGRAQPRRYRNRRIGEFLKELEFTEGRGTGVPKILRAMRQNGSPPPELEFDDDHSYFIVRLPVHPAALEVAESGATGTQQVGEPTLQATLQVGEPTLQATPQATLQVGEPTLQATLQVGEPTLQATPQATPQVEELLSAMEGELSRAEIMAMLGLKDRAHFVNSYLKPALEAELIEMTIPDTPSSMHQKYRLTASGSAVGTRELPTPQTTPQVEKLLDEPTKSPPPTKSPTLQATLQATPQATPQVEDLLSAMEGELSRAEIMAMLGLKDRAHFVNSYLIPALDAELIEMTIPDRPRSMHQKYRLTKKGADRRTPQPR